MADDATTRGDTAKATEYTQAAESFANRLVGAEREVESLKQLLLQATEAANQAKSAVAQNSMAMQKKLAERQKLMGQLDQAKMQEQVNRAMASLNETVGQDVPTFEEIRLKIETRYAKALGTSELTGDSVEQRMLEVEQAQINTEAQAKLADIKAQLGLGSGADTGGGGDPPGGNGATG
jgi:phage shock protein A